MKVKLAGTSKLTLTKAHYVYGLLDPRDSSLFYVGQALSSSKKPRYLQHIQTLKNTMQNLQKHKIIQEIKSEGFKKLLYVLFFETDSKIEAIEKEKELIAKYKPYLTNVSQGGIGGKIWDGLHPQKGKKLPMEWRLKMSAAKIGRRGNKLGFKLSEESKEKIRQNTIKQLRENPTRLVRLSKEQEETIQLYRSYGLNSKEISKRTAIGRYVIERVLGLRKIAFNWNT